MKANKQITQPNFLRGKKYYWLTSTLSLLPVCFYGQKVAPAADHPNVVIILGDDVGYGDLGCYGATAVTTPHVDQLAENGVQFYNAHSPASTSTPSRYSLLTGAYAWRRRVGILNGDAAMTIPGSSLTLPLMFKKEGYETGCIGKWHLGLGKGNVDYNKAIRPSPNDVGFDYSFIIPATPDRVPCVYIRNRHVVGLDPADSIEISYTHKIGNEPTGKDHPELLQIKLSAGHAGTIVNGISRIGYMSGGHSAWWEDTSMARDLTEEAVAFIKRNAHKPFFLYFASNDIHVPRVPSARFRGSSHCGVRGDVIQEFDWSVGEIMETLKSLHLDKNTIVILTSDNGPILNDGYDDGADRQYTSGMRPAGILRGTKYTLWEGGTRVPFLITWPGHIKPGVSDVPFPFIDLFASFAQMLHYPLHKGEAIDSKAALPTLLGNDRYKPYRSYVLEQNNNGGMALLMQDGWKLIPVESKATKTDQLFNINEDVSETTNLAREHQGIVQQIKKILSRISQGASTMR